MYFYEYNNKYEVKYGKEYFMEENYLKEKILLEITEEDEKKEILRNIINTRAALTNANKNFEFAGV